MKCVICRNGETKIGKTTVALSRNEVTVIIKGVTAEICENCGEYYLNSETTKQIMALAEKAVKNGAEIEVIRFAA